MTGMISKPLIILAGSIKIIQIYVFGQLIILMNTHKKINSPFS